MFTLDKDGTCVPVTFCRWETGHPPIARKRNLRGAATGSLSLTVEEGGGDPLG